MVNFHSIGETRAPLLRGPPEATGPGGVDGERTAGLPLTGVPNWRDERGSFELVSSPARHDQEGTPSQGCAAGVFFHRFWSRVRRKR